MVISIINLVYLENNMYIAHPKYFREENQILSSCFRSVIKKTRFLKVWDNQEYSLAIPGCPT